MSYIKNENPTPPVRPACAPLILAAAALYGIEVKKPLAIALFAALFLLFLTPMELGDVWWHLGTGKWIAEHRALPAADPFSATSTGAPGEGFVLRGFWASQLLFYITWAAAGLPGLIALKAAIFTLTLFIVALASRNSGARGPVPYLVLIPVAFILTYFDESRPQSLSFLFFALTLLILEREREREPAAASGAPTRIVRPATALLVVMPLWANMHPGFILGDGLIAAYMAEALLAGLRGRRPRRQLFRPPWTLLLVLAAAILLSLANPNGAEPLARSMGMVETTSAHTSSIHEHSSAREFAALTGQEPYHAALLGLIALCGASFLLSWRRPDPLRIALYAFFASMAVVAFRAGGFFALFAAVAIGRNASLLSLPGVLCGRAGRALALAALAALSIMVLLPRSILRAPVMDKNLIPLLALSHVEETGLPGNLYHPYEWGGFIIWRLHPAYKTFLDGRALVPLDIQMEVLNAGPDWRRILDRYNVNTLMYWPILPYEGSVPRIVLTLLEDPLNEWQPVYWDLQSIVFVRTSMAKSPIRKSAVWELLTSLLKSNIDADPLNPARHAALGEVYLMRGLRTDARRHFERALALDPSNRKADFWLRSIGTVDRDG